MTTDEAIKYVESVASYRAYMPPIREALQMAIGALREKQETEKNQPLTLEALKTMRGKPVYVVNLLEKSLSSWGIVCLSLALNYVLTLTCNDEWAGLQNKYYFQTYNTEWIAYIHKPDE